MKNGKYRKIRADQTPMPVFARLMLVLSVVLVAFSMAMHIMASIQQAAILVVGAAAVTAALAAIFAWNKYAALRHIVRGVLIALPLGFIVIAVVLWQIAITQNPDAPVGFNALFSFALALSHWQAINVMFIPALVAAASYGGVFDRVLLNVYALYNAGLTAFFVYVSSSQVGAPVLAVIVSSAEDTVSVPDAVLRFVYVAASLVFAGLTFVTAIGKDPAHSLIASRK